MTETTPERNTSDPAIRDAIPSDRSVRGVPRWRVWRTILIMLPAVIVWSTLLGWLAGLIYDRANWSRDADEATIREWLEEARNFRKTLPELIKEYAALLHDDLGPGTENQRTLKADELNEHIRALAEPTQMYANQLPLFPEIYTLEVSFPGFRLRDGSVPEAIRWDSNVPKPRQQNQTRLQSLEYYPLGTTDRRAVVRCEYHLHAYNTYERGEKEAWLQSIQRVALLILATVIAMVFVGWFLLRERRREIQQLQAEREAEHQRRELAEAQIKQAWAVRVQEELSRKLLEQELAATRLAQQADEAERAALEMKSQLYASIGIMAGSYAHNIKNLLVRPNDLLSRCLEGTGLPADQQQMIAEVKATLGTVTERLQQILRTVRRDPSKAEFISFDLNELVQATARTWADMGWDKWKVRVIADVCPGPLTVHGDISHLQQAIENLVFNARDATFEMRNHLRETARREVTDPTVRKQRLLEAAAWKGEIRMTTRQEAGLAILEVRDNGIGMTSEVRERCLETHFSTKRDNALFEGLSAGMGLGLSFVSVVLEHHKAQLEIESEPFRGTVFRIKMPLADTLATSTPPTPAATSAEFPAPVT